MGAIDLVVQIEAPPSVASGLQRIGRSGHRIEAVSEGVIFPKFRGDLVASAAVAKAMHDGMVEATRYPRNPLDIIAQQVVAMTAMDEWDVDELFATVRRAAPFAELGREPFDGVLDMLSGRYPSDEFAELRPRITWNRRTGTVGAREGAKRVAIANAGTIPDRGLYGVFLAGAPPGMARVGELDEEMVFESHPGEIFVLGASSWRIEEITHDRVLVSHAPGEPGRMPFWKGDRAGRPIDLGLAIGRLTHDLLKLPTAAAVERLVSEHDLDSRAATNLLQYLREQVTAVGAVPDDRTLVIERVRDELGDWRICVLSPRGGRVHAPWAMAASGKIRAATGIDVETIWGDDGFVVRYPDVDEPPDTTLLVPDPDEIEALVVRQLGGTALFAAKFRENASRSLLLPKRRPGMRAPLWQQRKRSADLLAVASRYGSFPVLLETYRECLRDFFDIPALQSTLVDVRKKQIRVVTVDSDKPSPFAASLLFSYVASFLYDGDAPLAERRAHALAVNQEQLRELLGDAELRDLLDAESIEAVARQLQRLDPKYHARSMDGVHDMLLALGDLTREEIHQRTASPEVADSIERLVDTGRAIEIFVAGQARHLAIEDAARARDALHVALPPGVPPALLAPARDPLADIASRYARTHAPFATSEFAARFGLGVETAERALAKLAGEGRLLEGEFTPGGTSREWTDPGVLRMVRRRALAKLRREVEPVEQKVLGRFLVDWHGILRRQRGGDALLDVVEQLQGAAVPASLLETEILAARLEEYDPATLDALVAAGEVVWVGVEPLTDRDGRVALYLADHLPRLLPPRELKARETHPSSVPRSDREDAIVDYLGRSGASFFGPLHEAVGGGYPAETVKALWNLVWTGLVTNDTVHALRAFVRAPARRQKRHRTELPIYRSRRFVPPAAEGRWSLVPLSATDATKWTAAFVQQLLARHGVVTREAVASEALPGGFSAIYPVLKAMEERGRVRRGYFVVGLGATQFALPGAIDLLRSLRDDPSDGKTDAIVLAATDPANPYGSTLKWLRVTSAHAAEKDVVSVSRGPTRTVGATVIIFDGALMAYLGRGDRQLLTWLPEADPERSWAAAATSRALINLARSGTGSRDEDESPRGMLLEEIDGMPASVHPLARYLTEAGFRSGAMGFRATFPNRQTSRDTLAIISPDPV
jgi:ATP-dependent Lhr-like helicase